MMKFNLGQKNTINTIKPPLRFIAVGDGVTKNLSIYEYGDDIIAVDYGIGFPGVDDVGVDFIIPDMSYLVENAHKVKGLLISHAHADHFGAVPHLLKELNIPIYANKITQAYIKSMLEEKQFKSIRENVKFHLLDPTVGEIRLGSFKVSAFGVNHSVPGSLGLVIDTPEGRILHIADFKIDPTPVLDQPMDLNKVKELSKDILCLVSDSLGARTKGAVPSEKTLDHTFPTLFSKYEKSQLFITTISSNISRMYQIIDAAVKAGRRVVPTGRSIDKSVKIARALGYLPFSDSAFATLKEARNLTPDSIVYLIAGCFGQRGSALDRLSRGEHRDVYLEEGAIVIFSAEPNPPGVDLDVEDVCANFVLAGAEVIDHTNFDNLHVSGHGHREELSKIASIVNPKYYIPKGGSIVQMHAYANMIYDMGVEKGKVFELQEGEVIEFMDGVAKKGERLEVHDQYFDGTSVSPIVIADRRLLSQDGVFVVIVPIDDANKEVFARVDVVTRGFIYVKESGKLVGEAKNLVNSLISKSKGKNQDWGALKSKIEYSIEKYLHKETGRSPMVIVHGAKF
uniref:Ribonuclease J n=1 Tax=candidate division WWE3 bacterium TaxID=2053526 RepID=A0A7C4TJ46_UNCKA